MLIHELMAYIESFAPLSLALPWDNCGLLVGDATRPVRRVLISLDLTPNAVKEAIALGADLILTHHPLIFKPLKNITDPLLLKLARQGMAVICLHTNLDVARYSVNHALADALGLKVQGHLSPESGEQWQHLSVTVPPENADAVARAAFAAGAGRVGNYASCSTRHPISGTFQPLPGADPYVHDPDPNGITAVEEQELEFMVDKAVLPAVVKAIHAAHPYETPLLYYYPVESTNPAYGLGLICSYKEKHSIEELAQRVGSTLHCPQVRIWTAGYPLDTKVETLAICGGAGNSILPQAQRKAGLVITGDITYHSMLECSIPILDAGHFYTEYPVLDYLERQLAAISLPCTVLPPEKHEYVLNFRSMEF